MCSSSQPSDRRSVSHLASNGFWINLEICLFRGPETFLLATYRYLKFGLNPLVCSCRCLLGTLCRWHSFQFHFRNIRSSMGCKLSWKFCSNVGRSIPIFRKNIICMFWPLPFFYLGNSKFGWLDWVWHWWVWDHWTRNKPGKDGLEWCRHVSRRSHRRPSLASVWGSIGYGCI